MARCTLACCTTLLVLLIDGPLLADSLLDTTLRVILLWLDGSLACCTTLLFVLIIKGSMHAGLLHDTTLRVILLWPTARWLAARHYSSCCSSRTRCALTRCSTPLFVSFFYDSRLTDSLLDTLRVAHRWLDARWLAARHYSSCCSSMARYAGSLRDTSVRVALRWPAARWLAVRHYSSCLSCGQVPLTSARTHFNIVYFGPQLRKV
jgi:hypothetical protein